MSTFWDYFQVSVHPNVHKHTHTKSSRLQYFFMLPAETQFWGHLSDTVFEDWLRHGSSTTRLSHYEGSFKRGRELQYFFCWATKTASQPSLVRNWFCSCKAMASNKTNTFSQFRSAGTTVREGKAKTCRPDCLILSYGVALNGFVRVTIWTIVLLPNLLYTLIGWRRSTS